MDGFALYKICLIICWNVCLYGPHHTFFAWVGKYGSFQVVYLDNISPAMVSGSSALILWSLSQGNALIFLHSSREDVMSNHNSVFITIKGPILKV